jgi:nitrite reductase (NO-forming)
VIHAPTRSCPRTGRSRRDTLPPGAIRPSDLLVGFLAVGVAWMVAAAVLGALAIASDSYELRWLALHFAFVGGISQLVLGAAQFFACAFLATDPPSRRMVRGQLAVWNCGTVAVAIGVRAGPTALTGVGGTLLLVGLGLFALSLHGMRRGSLQHAPWATRWYLAAALFLAVGATLGPLMDGGLAWSHGSLLGAHMVLNLAGWFGTAIVGTLHTFYASLTATRLRHPRLQAPTFAAWTTGIAALALAAAFNSRTGALAGWMLLLVAAGLLLVNLAGRLRAAERHPPAATLILGAQLAMVAAIVVAAALTIDAGATAALLGRDRVVVAGLAVAGWIGLTVVGSLVHLLTLMARVRRLPAPTPAPGRERVALAAGGAVLAGLGAAAAAQLLRVDIAAPAAAILIGAGYLGLGQRVAVLAVRAARAAPVRI